MWRSDTTQSTAPEGAVHLDSYAVTARGREFEDLGVVGILGLALPFWFVTTAVRNGGSPLGLGWLLVVAAAPSAVLLLIAALLSRAATYRVDATGVTLVRARRTVKSVPWSQVRRIQYGPIHVRLRGRQRKGEILVVMGDDGSGVFLNSLRHRVTAGAVREAAEATTRFARDRGIDTVECEVLDREFWQPLRGLRR